MRPYALVNLAPAVLVVLSSSLVIPAQAQGVGNPITIPDLCDSPLFSWLPICQQPTTQPTSTRATSTSGVKPTPVSTTSKTSTTISSSTNTVSNTGRTSTTIVSSTSSSSSTASVTTKPTATTSSSSTSSSSSSSASVSSSSTTSSSSSSINTSVTSTVTTRPTTTTASSTTKPLPSAGLRRRQVEDGVANAENGPVICDYGYTSCAVKQRKGMIRHVCLDTSRNLIACGGCPESPGSQDCSEIEGVSNVQCVRGICQIKTCDRYHKLSSDGTYCEAKSQAKKAWY